MARGRSRRRPAGTQVGAGGVARTQRARPYSLQRSAPRNRRSRSAVEGDARGACAGRAGHPPRHLPDTTAIGHLPPHPIGKRSVSRTQLAGEVAPNDHCERRRAFSIDLGGRTADARCGRSQVGDARFRPVSLRRQERAQETVEMLRHQMTRGQRTSGGDDSSGIVITGTGSGATEER
jgi:hypothetical protein